MAPAFQSAITNLKYMYDLLMVKFAYSYST